MSCTWVTVPEAARKIGKRNATIYRWIREERLKGDEVQELVNGQIVICLRALVRPRKRKRSIPRRKMSINNDLL